MSEEFVYRHQQFRTNREILASPEQVYDAISKPSRLSRWWGPSGFTNTFNTCDIKTGGMWSFVMHGPDGKNYPNESIFEKVVPLKEVVINHICEPKFQLSITLDSVAGGKTLVSWIQVFENTEVARRVEHIVVPSNEQNLDRLTAEVLSALKK